MRKLGNNAADYNTLPLWRSAREREYRALPYPAKRLVQRYGYAPADALMLARIIGWKIDQ